MRDESASASPGAATAAAIRTAVTPYRWRHFTPELVARLALAAGDRYQLQQALASLPGATVGRWARLEPVARGDARVHALVEVLATRRWNELTAATLGHWLSQALRP